jgi:hypothetical protein
VSECGDSRSSTAECGDRLWVCKTIYVSTPALLQLAIHCSSPRTCKGGVHRALSQHLAVYTVVGGGGDSADHLRAAGGGSVNDHSSQYKRRFGEATTCDVTGWVDGWMVAVRGSSKEQRQVVCVTRDIKSKCWGHCGRHEPALAHRCSSPCHGFLAGDSARTHMLYSHRWGQCTGWTHRPAGREARRTQATCRDESNMHSCCEARTHACWEWRCVDAWHCHASAKSHCQPGYKHVTAANHTATCTPPHPSCHSP